MWHECQGHLRCAVDMSPLSVVKLTYLKTTLSGRANVVIADVDYVPRRTDIFDAEVRSASDSFHGAYLYP